MPIKITSSICLLLGSLTLISPFSLAVTQYIHKTGEDIIVEEFPPITEQEIRYIFNHSKPIPVFDPTRRVEALKQCQHWQEPVPDPVSHNWYRAATTLHANQMKTAKQYQQMLELYEGAARRGHYRATMHLVLLYSQGARVKDNLLFLPESQKAKKWLYAGLKNEWVGALEWLSTHYHLGGEGFQRNEGQSLAYLQLAADLGDPLAQFELGKYFENRLKNLEKAEALYACAAAQGTLSDANDEWALTLQIDGYPQAALQHYQQAIMAGGQKGGESAFALFTAFISKEKNRDQEELNTFYDPIRGKAYQDLDAALQGGYDSQDVERKANPFLRFPRLNNVLPLPPAQVAEWRGIYSAMSEEDAAYYQNTPPAEYYLEQIRQSQYRLPEGYLSEPRPIKTK